MNSGFVLAATPSATEQLRSFFAAEWEYQLREHPEYATYVGDARITTGSTTGRRRHMRGTLLTPDCSYDGCMRYRRPSLSEQDRISRQMMLQQMQSSLESFGLKEWEMPISQINGIHLDLASMYAQMPFRTTKDYENYVARLHAIPAALDQTIVVMRLGMHDHMMQPTVPAENDPGGGGAGGRCCAGEEPFRGTTREIS